MQVVLDLLNAEYLGNVIVDCKWWLYDDPIFVGFNDSLRITKVREANRRRTESFRFIVSLDTW